MLDSCFMLLLSYLSLFCPVCCFAGVGGFLSSDCQQASKQANCNLAAVRRLLAEQLAVSLASLLAAFSL